MTPIHRRNPTTVERGAFCLLRFRPGPVRLSLYNLDATASVDTPMLTQDLVRASAQHSAPTFRNPDLKPSSELCPSSSSGYRCTPLHPALTERRKSPFCSLYACAILTTCSIMVVRTNSAISFTRPEIGFSSFSPGR